MIKAGNSDAFAIYRVFLWFIGVWPLEKKSAFQTIRYVVAASFKASFLLHTIVEMYLSNGPISDMADICLFFASALLALAKHTYLHMHRDKIAENLKCYYNDWIIESKSKSSLKIMKFHVKIYKYLFIVYNTAGYAGTMLFLLRPILVNFNAQKKLDSSTIDDFEYSFICRLSFLSRDFLAKYYVIILAIQYLQIIYVCTSGACTDCFFFALIFHLCAQLEILKLKWNKMDSKIVANGNEFQRSKLTELIRRHQKLTRLGENLEKSFNSVVLGQITTSIILICMSCFSVLIGLIENDYVTILLSTNCINFMTTESFIYGYASDYLISQSENVAQAVYSINWHTIDRRSRADVSFVIMRAQKPLSITAGKFFNVTRNTIIQLLKTAASYLSVMRLTLEVSYQHNNPNMMIDS